MLRPNVRVLQRTRIGEPRLRQECAGNAGHVGRCQRCAKDKFAIGYGGIGYKTQDVKLLAVSGKTGEPAVAPTAETVAQKKYPISRALQIYIPRKPKAHSKEYLAFILSSEARAIVGSEKVGFVPLPDGLLSNELAKLK